MKKLSLIAIMISATSFHAFADQSDDAIRAFAMKQAGFSVEQAIDKVSAEYPGIITDLEFDDHRGIPAYEVKVVNLANNEESELKISTQDGKMLKEENESLSILGVSQIDHDEENAFNALNQSSFDLQTTIDNIKKKYMAEVLEFELENEKGITFYEFKVVGEQGRHKILVNVATNEMIPVKTTY